jgi:competence protein ComEC
VTIDERRSLRWRAGRLLLARPFHIALGCLAAGLTLSTAPPHAAFVGAAAVAAGLALAARRVIPLAAIAPALVVTGAAVGQARLHALDAPALRIREGPVELRADLVTRPRPSAFGSSAEVAVSAGSLRGTRLLIRIPRWAHLAGGLAIGEELSVRGRVRPLRTDPVADFDYAAYLRRHGVAGELFVDRMTVTGRRRGGVAGVLDGMRKRAERAVAAGLPAPEAALARGMVLGQDEAIDESTKQDWRDSGLAHLLAVSGQNVMLLVTLAVPLLALAGIGPRARGLALLVLVALYVPLAGAGPSLQRAGVMGVAGIAAMALSRPASRWYALLLAAAVTLALNPRASGDPGWQLSFAAVAGILALGRPLAAALSRAGSELMRHPERPPGRALVRALAEGVAMTVAATLATAPLVAFHFGTVPLAGLVANLLALPAVAPAMWLGMVKAALGIATAVVPPAGALAELLGPVTSIPLAYLERLAERCADMRGGRLALPLRSPLAVCAAYAVLAAVILAIPLMRSARRRGGAASGVAAGPRRAVAPGPSFAERAAVWRRAPRSIRVAVLALVLAVLAFAASAGLEPPASPRELTVSFLDVGQGDATLVQDGHGASVLLDAGPPEGAAYRQLRAAGVRRLDLAVSTHQSRDHQGGFHEIFDRMPVGLLVENAYGTRDPDYRRLLAEADAHGIRHVPAQSGELLHVGRLTVEILGPPPRPPEAPPPEDPNPIGVAAIVSEGAFDMWLSADAESDAVLKYPLRPVEAMKVSHHGSADPGLPEVLERLQPRVAAIEVGAHNTYGHPTPATLAALRHAGVPTYRTDRDGTVTLTVAHGRMEVATER